MNAKPESEIEVRAERLQKLTEIKPNNERYLRDYAEVLIQLGQHMRADHILDRLHKLLIKMDKNDEADEVLQLRHTALESSQALSISKFLQQAGDHASMFQKPKRIRLEEGEYLFKQGNNGCDIFLICDGEFSAWKHFDNSEKPVLVGNWKAGRVVGDIGYFYDGERSVDLLANQTSELLRFSQKNISRLLLAYPDLEEQWRQQAETRRRMLLLSMNSMLAGLPENMRSFLAEHSEITTYKMFSVVAKEGQTIESVELVISGVLRRIVEGHSGDSHIFTSITPGQLIGWEASMHGHTGFSSNINLTSLIAMEPTTLIRIPMPVFQEILEIHPPLRVAVSRNIHTYVSDTLSTLRNIDDIK